VKAITSFNKLLRNIPTSPERERPRDTLSANIEQKRSDVLKFNRNEDRSIFLFSDVFKKKES